MIMSKKYVGLDVSKNKIVVAIAPENRDEAVRYWGSINHTKEAVVKLVKQLTKEGNVILDVCYEAGPTGFELHRWFLELSVLCTVTAPQALDGNKKIKTDKRDAIRLAQLWRAKELTPIYVPAQDDEALRDLTRAREDSVEDLNRHKQRLTKFLLRHQIKPSKEMNLWTTVYEEWLDTLRFSRVAEDMVFQEYRNSIREATSRIKRYEREMEQQTKSSNLAPLIQALQGLRGVALVTATTIAAELGDIAGRFATPGQLMSYMGLVPSESSSGGGRWQGSITKVGNAHVRRVLVEAAWSYRVSPAIRRSLRERLEGLGPEIEAISWEAQRRLHKKYSKMVAKGKHKGTVAAAVARELAGFIWAIGMEVYKRQLKEKARKQPAA
ncbi:IS110 family transposase [Ammoniphilus resinae]|uniref:Transposase n=1 Tax=Ammoniphilus resinae TaxID=861532 RepID=A0ABS4GXY2_9BACL|nr:IS110 family transposase [Ammoniphilus resinae]MBP1935134.1 transposase [Ammoniphilus resinae]